MSLNVLLYSDDISMFFCIVFEPDTFGIRVGIYSEKHGAKQSVFRTLMEPLSRQIVVLFSDHLPPPPIFPKDFSNFSNKFFSFFKTAFPVFPNRFFLQFLQTDFSIFQTHFSNSPSRFFPIFPNRGVLHSVLKPKNPQVYVLGGVGGAKASTGPTPSTSRCGTP